MKTIWAIILSVLFFPDVKGQDSIRVSMKPVPAHPRLLMTAGDEALIRKAVHTNATWREVHNAILRQCDSLLMLAPSQRQMEGIRLDVNRWCLYRVFYLCYAWRTTHERKYFQQAEKELLAICHFSDWNPSHYLDVAELTMAAAIGYDWLYTGLSSSARDLVRKAILQKGISTSYDTSYHAYRKWLSVTNNWNQVCNTGISYGAMAIYESDPVYACQVINRSIRSIVISMKDYEPDGAYAEGYGYWGYGSTYNVMFMDGLQKMFGSDMGLSGMSGFMKSAAYIENMIGPTGKCFNYSDAAEATSLQPAMFWFARRLNDPSLLWQERRHLEGASLRAQLSYRLLPLALLWGGGMDIHGIGAPKGLAWAGKGRNPVALFRTSWTDTNAIFIGVKGGSPSVTHGHMDGGSFIMEAEGVRWAMDFGYQNYHSLESKNIDLWDDRQGGIRWQVFRYTNPVHNTLTLDGQEQRVKGYASLAGAVWDTACPGAVISLTSLYAGELVSVNRGIALCENKYVVVRDELVAGDSAAVVRWSMLTPAAVEITGTDGAILSLDGKKLVMKVEGSTPVEMRTWITDPPPHEYDSPNPGTVVVGFIMRLPAGTKTVFNVFLMPGDAPPHLKPVKPLEKWN